MNIRCIKLSEITFDNGNMICYNQDDSLSYVRPSTFRLDTWTARDMADDIKLADYLKTAAMNLLGTGSRRQKVEEYLTNLTGSNWSTPETPKALADRQVAELIRRYKELGVL